MITTHLELILDDFRRNGLAPAEALVRAVLDGTLAEDDFRMLLGIESATADDDLLGECWRRVPGPDGLSASSLGRVRGRDGAIVVHRRAGSSAAGPMGAASAAADASTPAGWRPRRLHPESAALVARAFGADWSCRGQPGPFLSGVAWRPVAGWPAYEASPDGLVRSYFRGARRLAAPQRVLIPFWDTALVAPYYTLCGGRGRQRRVTMTEVAELAWAESGPPDGDDPSWEQENDDIRFDASRAGTARRIAAARRAAPAPGGGTGSAAAAQGGPRP